MRQLVVGNHLISDDSDVFVIAEIGHNHQGNLERCKEMFRVAKECGVNAVKLQKRDNRSLYTEQLFNYPYDNENSFGTTYGAHREALEFGWDAYVELDKYARELSLVFFATTFDFASTDFLEKLGVPAYKIASGDITNTPLLKYVAQTQKPMIVSTGGASMSDVQRAYDTIIPLNPNLCLLQCTSCYPCEPDEMNLKVIETYRNRFPDIVIGCSDHQNGISMATVAYILGARMIEKHFTLNHTWKGTDHAFSLGPTGMAKLIRDLHRTKIALGDGVKIPFEREQSALKKLGKKLVAARDLPYRHVLRPEDIAIKSPNDGLPPYMLDVIVGKRLLRPISQDESIATGDLDD